MFMSEDSQKRREHEERTDLAEQRGHLVVKSNELIQKSRHQLTVLEQKIVLYLISKIKPEDMELKEHTFEIRNFCKVCGFEIDSGANYKYIKQTLKDLRDKSIWAELDNGAETTLAWFDKVTINRKSGAIILKIDDMMKPYLLQLRERFTRYELLYTLAMRSQYSIRLYELLKSYEWKHHVLFEVEELKHRLSAENYTRYPDFKRYVLDISMREINDVSDMSVTYEVTKVGRRFAKIDFSMQVKKDIEERMKTWARIDEVINPDQTSIFGSWAAKRQENQLLPG